MKIAVNVSPLTDPGHKVRGVGFYLTHLKRALEENNNSHSISFFKSEEDIDRDIDIVHYPYFDPFVLQHNFKKSYKKVVTIHDLTPLVFPEHFPVGIKGKLRWNINRQLVRNLDAVITDSISSQKDCLRFLPLSKEKVSVVYLAADEKFKKIELDEKEKQALVSKFKLPKEFLLYVGDATWNKNLPNLLTAATEQNISLVLVGKTLAQEKVLDHPWNKSLLQAREIIKKSKCIYSIGFVTDEELTQLYNLANGLCMPSYYEGFGLPIVEAMQSGCPVLTSDKGSLSEVGGDAVLYVDPYNTASIAEGMKKLLTDSKVRFDLQKKGFVQAQKFSWGKTAQDTLRVYENIA